MDVWGHWRGGTTRAIGCGVVELVMLLNDDTLAVLGHLVCLLLFVEEFWLLLNDSSHDVGDGDDGLDVVVAVDYPYAVVSEVEHLFNDGSDGGFVSAGEGLDVFFAILMEECQDGKEEASKWVGSWIVVDDEGAFEVRSGEVSDKFVVVVDDGEGREVAVLHLLECCDGGLVLVTSDGRVSAELQVLDCALEDVLEEVALGNEES